MKPIRIAAVSDLHGQLVPIPPADVLIIAGDVVPLHIQNNADESTKWLMTRFDAWRKQQPVEITVMTWGNHDWVGQLAPDVVHYLPWRVLVDEKAGFMLRDGRAFTVYGSPWTPEFMGWAFNKPREELAETWSKIPEGVDILVTHGPPQGVLDDTGATFIGGGTSYDRFAGCHALWKRIHTMKQPPKVHLFGHIHRGYGAREVDGTRYFNVAVCNEQYRPLNPVTVFEL